MPSVTITIEGNTTAKLRALSMAIQSPAGLVAGATGVRREVKAHFLTLPANVRGYPTSNFWGRAAESVTQRVEGETAIVAATQVGVRRRFFGTGGPITPSTFGGDKQFFAVPNQPETYGKMARDYPKDAMKFTHAQDENGDWHAALVANDDVHIAKRGEGPRQYDPSQVMFWLYRTIDQPPNPNVLPTPDEMYQAFGDGMLEFIRAKMHDPSLNIRIDEGQ